MVLGVGIGRRDGFGATIGREAISAQDIGFLGVATGEVGGVIGGVSGSEFFEVTSAGVIGGVSNNAGSLGGGGVARGVGIAAAAFGVGGGVGIAALLVVILAGSLGVVIAATSGTASDTDSAVSLRGGVGGDRFSCCRWSNF